MDLVYIHICECKSLWNSYPLNSVAWSPPIHYRDTIANVSNYQKLDWFLSNTSSNEIHIKSWLGNLLINIERSKDSSFAISDIFQFLIFGWQCYSFPYITCMYNGHDILIQSVQSIFLTQIGSCDQQKTSQSLCSNRAFVS